MTSLVTPGGNTVEAEAAHGTVTRRYACAILVGPEQPWMTTEQFFDAIVKNLETATAGLQEQPQAIEPARA